MNNLVIDKYNFWTIVNKFYSMINYSDKSISINYSVIDKKINMNDKQNMNMFLAKMKNNPIQTKLDPLTFQQNARNEWK